MDKKRDNDTKIQRRLGTFQYSATLRVILLFNCRFQMSNKGGVAMDYNWQMLMENYTSPGPRSVTFARTDTGEETGAGSPSRPGTAATTGAMAVRTRPGSAVPEYRPDTPTSTIITDVAYTPYSIEPETGTVQPGKKATFRVKFSPLDVQECDARLICSIPNLEQGKNPV